MFLKLLLSALALFASGVGALRVSVMLENYVLLIGGVLLSSAAVLLLSRASLPESALRG